MKNILFLAMLTLMVSCVGQQKELDNVFYVFNNGLRDPLNVPEGYEAQAELVKKIGYDGISGHPTQNNMELRAALEKNELVMPEIYWGLTITDEGTIEYNKDIDEVVKSSKQDLLVAFYTGAKKYKHLQEEGDKIIADWLRDFADFAAEYGVKVAIYPHVNNYCETIEHTLRVVDLVDQENMGVIFNTCHLLKVEGDEGWEEKALKALPKLFMVSVNGADAGDHINMGWDKLIQPLGEGSFDVYELVKFFKDNGYDGPFGLQCYNIKEDCEVALTKSMNTWKEYQERYKNE